jgi:hypothetical protein
VLSFSLNFKKGEKNGGIELLPLSFSRQIRQKSEIHPRADLAMAHQLVSGLEGLYEVFARGPKSQSGGAISSQDLN